MGKDKNNKLTFKYVCPDNLRDLYVNGALVGATPRGEINVHFYSERVPIPKEVTYRLKDDGTVGDEKQKESGGDVLRLVQTSVVMDIKTARALRDWLDDKINALKREEGVPPLS